MQYKKEAKKEEPFGFRQEAEAGKQQPRSKITRGSKFDRFKRIKPRATTISCMKNEKRNDKTSIP